MSRARSRSCASVVYWPVTFSDKHAPANAGDEARESCQALPLVTEAVRDVGWWAFLSMLLRVGQVVSHIESWMEGCACHYKSEGATDSSVFCTRSTCKMAGRRSPEPAVGALDVLLQERILAHQLELAVDCAGLAHDARDRAMKAYSKG